jgi:hypothetical protein
LVDCIVRGNTLTPWKNNGLAGPGNPLAGPFVAVTIRTREIGIRMALGASGAQVIRLVLRGASVMVAVGVGVGVAAPFAVTRLLAVLVAD